MGMATSITRVKGKALKDDVEGWVTIKGNAGTAYAQVSDKHCTILDEVPLQTTSRQTAKTVRMLKKGEAVEMNHTANGPIEELCQSAMRVKGRALSDGALGWVTLRGNALKPWSPYHTCLIPTALHSTRD